MSFIDGVMYLVGEKKNSREISARIRLSRFYTLPRALIGYGPVKTCIIVIKWLKKIGGSYIVVGQVFLGEKGGRS